VEGSNETVLVVEDSDSMRLLCRVNLELEGYRVLEASTLAQAESFLRDEPVRVVLLDVHIGDENGYDLLRRIRDRRQIGVALITGSADVRADERALVDAVIPKPFSLEELSSTVGRLAKR
jgi:DNA-binding response OmpR family regulator